MDNSIVRILVVTGDAEYHHAWRDALIAAGCDVVTESQGGRALQLLRRRMFDVVVSDDSCADMGPIEFALNVRDIGPNHPLVLLAGKDLDRFSQVWRHCNVGFAGAKEGLLRAALDNISRLRGEASARS